jgi:diguanylate cyclase (GGDEF)-like protein
LSIAILTFLTGGAASPFIYGFYLLVALASFYYGLWPGVLMASATFLSDFFFVYFTGTVDKVSLYLFRWGFYWVLAFSSGLLSQQTKYEKKLLEKLSNQLNQKVETLKLLFEIGKNLASYLDFEDLKILITETLLKGFRFSSFLFLLYETEPKKKSWEFCYEFGREEIEEVENELKRFFSREERRETSTETFELGNWTVFQALKKPDAQIILVLKKREIENLSPEERSSFFLLATQLAVAIYNSYLYAKTKELSVTDDLTGIYNHRYFKRRLYEEIERAKRTGQPLSLILLDLDNFKLFNDNFGHLKGDEALRWVGMTLKSAARKMDIPSRYGGDEFAIICPNTDLDKAIKVAQRLQRELHKVSFENSPGFFFTASVGVATYPEHAQNMEELVNKADEALFKAKKEGKSLVKTA